MKKKKVLIWIIVIGAVVGILFYFLKPKDSEVEYVTASVNKTDIVQTVSVTGEIAPVNNIDLSFENSGKVDSMYVDVGDNASEGDKIATLDDTVAQSQLNEAFLELDRQTEILQQARRDWDDLSPDEKASAKLTEEKARAAVWTIQKQMSRNTIYSPINGIVTKRYVDEGELITATSPVVTVMGEGGFEITAEIPESDIAKIKLGQRAEVTFDAFSSDEIFDIEVSKIEPAATIIQDVVYYEVTFDILTKDDRFRSGMSADIDVATAEKNGVLAVPGQAVKSENGSKYVEVLVIKEDDQKETKKTDVNTGLRGDDGMIEITSGDLKEGDEVVTFVKEK